MKSSTEAVISYATPDLATAAVEYARVGPGITTIQWQRAQHTYKDQEQKFTLTGLQPNSEYVYRIVSSEDNTWAGSTKSRFDWFATKTSLPSVCFRDLQNQQGVDSLAQVVLRASGSANARFSQHGITAVRLYVDGKDAGNPIEVAGSDYLDCTFDLSGMQLVDGVHILQATAVDDYWHTGTARLEVLLTANQMQGQSVAAFQSTQQTQASQQLPKVPKKNRSAQSVQQLSLKHALKVLQSWKKTQSTDQQKWASIAEGVVQGWISSGHDLAKSNTSQMNASAFMLYNLGGYKKNGDVRPARAGRRTIGSGENKCSTAVGDAYVLGNKHKKLKYGTDWSVKSADHVTPVTAYYLADKGTTLVNLVIEAGSPRHAGDIVARGRCLPGHRNAEGHVGIFITNNTTISANPDHGIRFGDWVNAYTKVKYGVPSPTFWKYEDHLTRHFMK